MLGIINKPQFDVNVFVIGTAMEMRRKGYTPKDIIITKNDKLQIEVGYYNIKYNSFETILIDVEDVINGKYTFERLEVMRKDDVIQPIKLLN